MICFWKCLKFDVDLKIAQKDAEKVFLFEINASELFELNCLY